MRLDFHPPAFAVACSGAPRPVNSTARPTCPECPVILPSTPAALAAAASRRAMDWPLRPPSTWAVGSGRRPERCTVRRSRSWRSASVLEIANVRRGAVLVSLTPADVDHDAASVGRVLHVGPAECRCFRPAQPALKQQARNRLVYGGPLGGRLPSHSPCSARCAAGWPPLP